MELTKIIWFFKSKILSNIAGKKNKQKLQGQMSSEVAVPHRRSPSEFQSLPAGRGDRLQTGHKCRICIIPHTCVTLCPVSRETWLSCPLVLVTYPPDSNWKVLEWKIKYKNSMSVCPHTAFCEYIWLKIFLLAPGQTSNFFTSKLWKNCWTGGLT